ncbi:hypothetical protein ACH5RR_026190 [Cinchona calisaya]|uniref:Uncharacterized protein n=1 Tax=Cinchona calisaya TaxID=153742 RepID=A0ABD2Z2Y9_9GENT
MLVSMPLQGKQSKAQWIPINNFGPCPSAVAHEKDVPVMAKEKIGGFCSSKRGSRSSSDGSDGGSSSSSSSSDTPVISVARKEMIIHDDQADVIQTLETQNQTSALIIHEDQVEVVQTLAAQKPNFST